jgi:flagellar protein FlaF
VRRPPKSFQSWEAAIRNGAARYQKASQQALSARETELAAFASVTRGLEEADSTHKRIRALGRNHDLWSTLVKDLALEENRLPPELKNQLISLGVWSMQYSTRAILQDMPVKPLIEVNRNIADGLSMQRSANPQVKYVEPIGA